MPWYTLVVFLHIASSCVLIGTSIVGEPTVRATARRTNRPRDLLACLEVGGRMAPMSPFAALVVLATGLYLTSVIGAWTLGWVQLSMALWLVNSVVAVRVVKPALLRVATEAAAAGDESVGPRLDEVRWSAAWTWGVDILATNDATMLFVMVLKPGLGGSLATLGLAYAVVMGVRVAVGTRSRRAFPRVEAARAVPQ